MPGKQATLQLSYLQRQTIELIAQDQQRRTRDLRQRCNNTGAPLFEERCQGKMPLRLIGR